MKTNRPLIIAHRGASGEAPENTLAAFQLAVKKGCDAIELDIHLTKDGKLAVIHDDNINRTTNGVGLVREMTATELKKYDAGSWFDRKFKGERIPLLEEVFEIVPREIIINIEIKNTPFYYDGIEEKLHDFLVKRNRMNQVFVSSFDYLCLYRLKKLNNDIKIGLLYYEDFNDYLGWANHFGLPVDVLQPHFQSIREHDVRIAIENGLKIIPWTVNSKSNMEKMICYGVSGIVTNYPGRLKALLDGK
ncbi:MAG TPA: glycerophosphodiester phosphodiesterase [Bacillus bacterium]|nr:glycerophosphodiester phosphodiesterase [Bacillus sp. (in: firmicutes)]